ncbi:diaminohydroxyphosphoribosylaminopyrimidine deaminase [Veronia nyctiphanis]|uniref:Diaminohydroxyphosphoribosylaminopyrimidine deaminase n=1 Tax=Veronia nyctiphanis TaxID=1278244 RepID=A0A4Q0YQK1_9GAMM|nr:NAD-dependent epimerase/dehydratase family protein [Veronia nyctiphanis]RXJ72833.1 diaminohydroxyphosphoribosylaminopyrimidine deaminase [Veronia nyctiphanis]
MSEFFSQSPVLVTGANGYVASWIVKKLLDAGNTVHATVRDRDNEDKVGHLKAMAASSGGKLCLFNANLLDEGAYDEAILGCEIVFHTASPFVVRGVKDNEKDLLEPAKLGTKNVLDAVNRTETVKRVVLTSSVAAIYGDSEDLQHAGKSAFDETDWNLSSSAVHQPYSYSKTIAEQLAWQMNKGQNRWQLLTINPGLVLGPTLGNTGSESMRIFKDLYDGKLFPAAPDLTFGIVDVRDVAKAHLLAAFTENASGRHITVAGTMSYLDIATVLREHFKDKAKLTPKFTAPKSILWLVAPLFGITRAFISKNVGYKLAFDNSYIQRDLGMKFDDLDKCLIDHFAQVIGTKN